MKFDHRHYVPCLRWKMGEYQAVYRLSDTKKRMFTPLIEVPEIGWDFEKGRESKSIDVHLEPQAKRIRSKWGDSPCFVDLRLVEYHQKTAAGIHPVRFVFDGLHDMECSPIPVTGIDKDSEYQQAIGDVVTQHKSGVCLRIGIEQAAKGSLKSEIDSLLSKLKVKPKICHLIIDLGAPNFIPLEGFSKAIQAIVSRFPYLDDWLTFALLGSSFPETMASIRKGGQTILRDEWQLYVLLVANFQNAGLRVPTFSDYGISHPKVIIIDMRIAKPSATIRYTANNNWYIVKGENVRDHGFKQYRNLSKQVLDSRYYCAPTFSWGDEYIYQCANGGKTGNLTMWRQVGTNHHIVKVTQDIASFYDSLNTF